MLTYTIQKPVRTTCATATSIRRPTIRSSNSGGVTAPRAGLPGRIETAAARMASGGDRGEESGFFFCAILTLTAGVYLAGPSGNFALHPLFPHFDRSGAVIAIGQPHLGFDVDGHVARLHDG
ncbi:hypothetical protein PG996_004485 [Apiospora saccharicola]|uniref:Uncharacterized protein n=1 Tax=Apiospora saccharicola TaxID=335842 RepID=A0ABR1W4B2_9PEZI